MNIDIYDKVYYFYNKYWSANRMLLFAKIEIRCARESVQAWNGSPLSLSIQNGDGPEIEIEKAHARQY